MTRQHLAILNLSLELRDSMVMFEPKNYFGLSTNATFDEIVDTVCDYFGVYIKNVKSANRESTIKNARFFCMYFIRRLLKDEYSLEKLAEYFGGRHHSTVINAVRTVTERLMNEQDGDVYKVYHKFFCEKFNINPKEDITKSIEEYHQRASKRMIYKQKKIIKFPVAKVKEEPKAISINRNFPRDGYSNKNHWAM